MGASRTYMREEAREAIGQVSSDNGEGSVNLAVNFWVVSARIWPPLAYHLDSLSVPVTQQSSFINSTLLLNPTLLFFKGDTYYSELISVDLLSFPKNSHTERY